MQLLFSLSSNACTQGRVFVFAAEAEAEGCSLAAGAALAVLSFEKRDERDEKREAPHCSLTQKMPEKWKRVWSIFCLLQ